MAKRTGLGTDAIFGGKPAETPQQPVEAPQKPPEQPAVPPASIPSEPPKMRTTVMLAPDVLILLNRMKEASLAAGARQTQGEIIEEAIRTLARIKDIKA